MITGRGSFVRLLFFLFFIDMVLMIITCSPDDSATTTPPPLQGPNYASDQLRNVIQALVGAGDFGEWSDVLYGLEPISLPSKATLFLPSDQGLMRLPSEIDSFSALVRYHIVPQQLSFYDLLRNEAGARLPTMLPNRTILVTNNTRFNFTLDDCSVIYPGIYYDRAIAAHGISCLLDYSLYGVQRETTLRSDGSKGGFMLSYVPMTSGQECRTHYRDSRSFRPWLKQHSPGDLPGGVHEFWLCFLLFLIM
ncbi:unnamed protein product [Victoria cruziana]